MKTGGIPALNDVIVRMENICKAFPGVKALDDVHFELRSGEVMALLGENGAGKSTLIKVISGAIEPDEGNIIYEGISYPQMKPAQARKLGIEVIYQEFNLVETISAAENIFLGHKEGSFVNRKAMNEAAKKLFDEFGIDWRI